MISMQQQTVLKDVTGPEQPQEEVELTELLPVKQSRIRENVFKDADATDALRALRSLSGDCADGENFDLREFNFCKSVNRSIQSDRQGGRHRSVEARRKKAEETKSKDFGEEKNTEMQEKNRKVRNGRRIARAKVPKKKLTKSSKKKDRRNGYVSDKSTKRNNDEEEDDDDEDDEEESYLEKEDCFKNEIYVYRRKSVDPCSDSEESSAINHNDLSEDYSYDTTDGELSREKKKSKKISGEKKEKCWKSKTDDTTEKESPEKELRLRIDAIIQANYLLERENNNLVGSDEENIAEHASCAGVSVNAERSDSSLGSSVEKEKRTKRRQLKDQQNLQKKYCCVVCEARFKGSGGLRNHYKVVHGAGPVFKCDECGKEFPLKERLKLHVRTHTGFKPYKCPECDKSFARGGQLVQHRRTHSQIRPFHCKLCSNTFTCAANLSLHLKRHNGQKDHKCDLCGRAFVRRDALKKHLECLHRDVKSFLCAICNKTFKGHLPQHMRTHARDRPHGCATCGQRFAQKSQLTVHQRTHSGQRPFRCLVCWQAFAHSTALKLHTRRHTGERPFKCSECNAGFTQLPHWKKHMKCIHGRNDPYGCKRCKSFFRIKSDLESHEKTCHPEMEVEDEDGGISSKPAGSVGAVAGSEIVEKNSVTAKYKLMTVEKMRLLLAVLLKRISKQERLDELGFGKRLIDDVLQDSLVSAGKEPVTGNGLSELEALTRNLEIFLEWTVPKEHWENFRKMKKSPEDILETLTAT
ncbi:hypothetical protein PUN28_008983 [Cardiocondyla obscurior]|uniref:C2H2-type domain-containing protein n=1 Tax=Cardiocondyla obscurior TaxID=286306 RepID=A0AAW2FS01_9HYME